MMAHCLLIFCLVALVVPASSMKCHSCVGEDNGCTPVTCPRKDDKCITSTVQVNSFPCKGRSVFKGCVKPTLRNKSISISPNQITRLALKDETCDSDLCNKETIADNVGTRNDLYCHSCISPGASCNSDSMKTMRCSGQQNQCLDLKVIGTFGDVADMNIKGCGEVPLCSPSLQFTSHTSSVAVQCCNNNFCNSATGEVADDRSPNGVQCYSCNTFDNISCAPNEVTTAQCYGTLTSCLEVAGLVIKDGKPVPAVIKGCATSAMCDSSVLPLMLKVSGATVECCTGSLCNNKYTVEKLNSNSYFPIENAPPGTGYTNESINPNSSSVHNTAMNSSTGVIGLPKPGGDNSIPKSNESSTSNTSGIVHPSELNNNSSSIHNMMPPWGHNGTAINNSNNVNPGGNNNSSHVSNTTISDNGYPYGNDISDYNTYTVSSEDNNNGSSFNDSYMINPPGDTGNESMDSISWMFIDSDNDNASSSGSNSSIKNHYNQYGGNNQSDGSKTDNAWTNIKGHNSNIMYPGLYNNGSTVNYNTNPIHSSGNNTGTAYGHFGNLGNDNNGSSNGNSSNFDSGWGNVNTYNPNMMPHGNHNGSVTGNNYGLTNGNSSNHGSAWTNTNDYNSNMMHPGVMNGSIHNNYSTHPTPSSENHNGSATGNNYGLTNGNGSNYGNAWTNTNDYNPNMMHPGVMNGSIHNNYSTYPTPSSGNHNGSATGNNYGFTNGNGSNHGSAWNSSSGYNTNMMPPSVMNGSIHNNYSTHPTPSSGNHYGFTNDNGSNQGNAWTNTNDYNSNMMYPGVMNGSIHNNYSTHPTPSSENHNGSATGNNYGLTNGNGSNYGNAWTNTNDYNPNMMHPGVMNGSIHNNYSTHPTPSSGNHNGSATGNNYGLINGNGSNYGNAWTNTNDNNPNMMHPGVMNGSIHNNYSTHPTPSTGNHDPNVLVSGGNDNGSSYGTNSNQSFVPPNNGPTYGNGSSINSGWNNSIGNVHNMMPTGGIYSGSSHGNSNNTNPLINNNGLNNNTGNSSSNTNMVAPGTYNNGLTYGSANNVGAGTGDGSNSNSYNSDMSSGGHNSGASLGNGSHFVTSSGSNGYDTGAMPPGGYGNAPSYGNEMDPNYVNNYNNNYNSDLFVPGRSANDSAGAGNGTGNGNTHNHAHTFRNTGTFAILFTLALILLN